MASKTKDHWDTVYTDKKIETLGWYEDYPKICLDLITGLNLKKDANILFVGAGASTLIDNMVEMGYSNIIATDISKVSLEKINSRLPDNSVRWIVDDITKPTLLNELKSISLWHDRALLHFLTEDIDRKEYFNLVSKLVKIDGHVIIAVFAMGGAKKCSGLDIRNYSVEMIKELLGDGFIMIDSFNYTYVMPNGGTRPYIYTNFKRIK